MSQTGWRALVGIFLILAVTFCVCYDTYLSYTHPDSTKDSIIRAARIDTLEKKVTTLEKAQEGLRKFITAPNDSK